MRHVYFLLFFIVTATALRAMEQAVVVVKTAQDCFLFSLPCEMQKSIFSHALCGWQKSYTCFYYVAETGYTLGCLNKYCVQFFSIAKVAELMNMNDTNKNIFLMHAAHAGIPCLVKYAINSKAALDHFDTTFGFTPLSIATRIGNYKSCVCLLEAGANPNQAEHDNPDYDPVFAITPSPNRYLPMHIAAKGSKYKFLELLLQYKADVNGTNYNEATPGDITMCFHCIDLLARHGGIQITEEIMF